MPSPDSKWQNKSPAFQFYAPDWMVDGKVRMMGLEAQGAYVRLLCSQWIEGHIPDDVKQLAIICDVSTRKMRTLWAKLEQFFPLLQERFDADSELSQTRVARESSSNQFRKRANSRLSQQRKEREEWIEKSRIGGKLGAEKRWSTSSRGDRGGHEMAIGDPKENGMGVVKDWSGENEWPNGSPNDDSSSSSSSSSSIKNSTPPTARARGQGPEGEEPQEADQGDVTQRKYQLAEVEYLKETSCPLGMTLEDLREPTLEFLAQEEHLKKRALELKEKHRRTSIDAMQLMKVPRALHCDPGTSESLAPDQIEALIENWMEYNPVSCTALWTTVHNQEGAELHWQRCLRMAEQRVRPRPTGRSASNSNRPTPQGSTLDREEQRKRNDEFGRRKMAERRKKLEGRES